jgi:hypothetical protein
MGGIFLESERKIRDYKLLDSSYRIRVRNSGFTDKFPANPYSIFNYLFFSIINRKPTIADQTTIMWP